MDIEGLVRVVMEEVKSTVRPDTVIGTPVEHGDSMVIPVSRVSYGFGVGGSEYDAAKALHGMGAGAGVTIEPLAVLVLAKGKVRLLSVKKREAMFFRLIDIIPVVLKTIRSGMNGRRKKTPKYRSGR